MRNRNTSDGANVVEESDRSLSARLVAYVFALLRGPASTLEDMGNRLAPVVKGLLVSTLALVVATTPAAAQEYCDEGVGLLIADTQVMLWQMVLGMLVIIAMLGLILRAFPLFTGATAAGNLMIVGVIVGVIGFVFILTFIDFAFGVVGGPGIGEGCSPFL